MRKSVDDSAMTQYFQAKLVVVEVRQGENQEDAWRRHITENPEHARARVKIFHYPEPSPVKKKGKMLPEFPLAVSRERVP